jgi:hypothetical protein
MSKSYRQLTESIKGRINPENFALRKSFSDELATVSYSEVLTYIRLAMKGVEPEYTQKNKDAGERVKDDLSKKLSDVTFKYQGSVMTDTHIKGYSDIDLLTIIDKFYWYDTAKVKQILESYEKRAKYRQRSIEKMEKEVNVGSYQGNALQDLRQLRIDSEDTLTDVYEICDTSKPKSIKIKNQSLNREVDVVIANWYDDVSSIINEKGDYRGIQVYNKESHSKGDPDFPFLSIKRINERSSETNERLKRMIRFLKNVKADSDKDIDLNSFDINAVCYDIEVPKYQTLSFYELVPVISNQLKEICTNQTKADSIISVDGREYIFRFNSKKLNNLKILMDEVEGIFIDLRKTLGI